MSHSDYLVNDYEQQLSQLRQRVIELERQITATMRANEHLAAALLEKIRQRAQTADTITDL